MTDPVVEVRSDIGPDHCSRWSGIPQEPQTDFTRRAIGLLCTTLGAPWRLAVNWRRVDWRYGRGVSFILGNRPCLATWDVNGLTRLVIGAHDECIRVEIEPHGFGYLRISMWPRSGREGKMGERHPTMEQAIEQYRAVKHEALRTMAERAAEAEEVARHLDSICHDLMHVILGMTKIIGTYSPETAISLGTDAKGLFSRWGEVRKALMDGEVNHG